jgi:hypothetical protein
MLEFLIALCVSLALLLVASWIFPLPRLELRESLHSVPTPLIWISLAITVIVIARVAQVFFERRQEKASQQKWNSSHYDKGTEGAANFAAVINEARAYREAKTTERNGKRFGETLTIVLLCIAAIVAYLQWGTLEKTDQTLRAGQRAFVVAERRAEQSAPSNSCSGLTFQKKGPLLARTCSKRGMVGAKSCFSSDG